MTKFLTGDGVVIADAVVNFGIEYYTDKYEDESFDIVRGNLRDISISLIYKKWDLIFLPQIPFTQFIEYCPFNK